VSKCVDHLNFCGTNCEDCGLFVDAYGNTEDQFDYCSFPDCGCDGERLCMASNGASDNARDFNVEGMYSMKGAKGVVARTNFLSFIAAQDLAKKL
jgi:hypothetical protein